MNTVLRGLLLGHVVNGQSWTAVPRKALHAVYNKVHLYVAESDPYRRKAWIAAIDTIEALDPRAVISGHKRASCADDPHILEETRQYIRDFDRIDAAATTARDLYNGMFAIYPDLVNLGVALKR